MILTSYRLVQRQLVKNAFDGEGARKYGGRWNPQGVRVVYTASSLSLAALELLAHLESRAVLEHRYAFIAAQFSSSLCLKLEDFARLPPKWFQDPPPRAVTSLGARWVREQSSAILSVPSSIVPAERNYLLNPAHPDFRQITLAPAKVFAFDPRLIKVF